MSYYAEFLNGDDHQTAIKVSDVDPGEGWYVLGTQPPMAYHFKLVNGTPVKYSDEEIESYMGALSLNNAWLHLRRTRDSLLRQSDWTQKPDTPETIKALWAPYRQALRELPSTTTTPFEVEWPTQP